MDELKFVEEQFLWKLEQAAKTIKDMVEIRHHNWRPEFEKAFDVLINELSWNAESLQEHWEHYKAKRRAQWAKLRGELGVD